MATVWTTPLSARIIDQLATGLSVDMENWVNRLSKDKKLALSNEDRIQTQILYGEAVIVTETKGGWAKIFIPSQGTRKDTKGYPGWVPLYQLEEVSRNSWYRPVMAAVKNKTAWLEDERGRQLIHLSYMTSLPVESVKGNRIEVVIPGGKAYLPKVAVELFPTELGGARENGNQLIRTGEKFIGLEYLWGGMSAFGYDCSGFVYTVHKANGYQIARDATDQATKGNEISQAELLPGDLLFFANNKGTGRIHHVGFYYGDGKMLHAPSTGKEIEIVHLSGTKYEREFCIARRYWEAED